MPGRKIDFVATRTADAVEAEMRRHAPGASVRVHQRSDVPPLRPDADSPAERLARQLTGDNDFASPETLVAFALGLTLFVITLGLNVFALYIVRKYREQYE